MTTELLHIGELIKARLDELGMSQAEFGRRLNMGRQQIYGMLQNRSIDLLKLKEVCTVLNYDFFSYYRPASVPQEISINANLLKDFLTSGKMSINIEVDKGKQNQVAELLST